MIFFTTFFTQTLLTDFGFLGVRHCRHQKEQFKPEMADRKMAQSTVTPTVKTPQNALLAKASKSTQTQPKNRCRVSAWQSPTLLPITSTKSVQSVPARIEEPVSLVRHSSSGGVTKNLSFSKMP